MKRSFIIILILVAIACLGGCSGVNVGGSGSLGGISGSGQVNIPIPKGNK